MQMLLEIALDVVKTIVARTSRTVSKNVFEIEVVQRKSYQIMEQCLSRKTVSCFVLNGGLHGNSV